MTDVVAESAVEPTAVVDEAESDEQEDVLPTFEISAYGADYPVDGLVKRLKAKDIDLPEFQRGFIWTPKQCARFVESLLLGLPVPGIFLYKETGSNKLLVVDGQQRLKTLEAFYKGILNGKSFVLPKRGKSAYQSVHPRFEGATYESLADEDRRRLDDSIIHATVIKQEEPSGDLSSVYHIFERINSAGTRLQPQEIRTAIYQGDLLKLVSELDETDEWRAVYGSPSKRLKDQELVLRFFALYYNIDNYSRPMADFLNDFTANTRTLSPEQQTEARTIFLLTVKVVHDALGRSAFRPGNAINAAVFDAVMVGLARKLSQGSGIDIESFKSAYHDLLSSEDFIESYSRATSDAASVSKRVELATEAFSKLN